MLMGNELTQPQCPERLRNCQWRHASKQSCRHSCCVRVLLLDSSDVFLMRILAAIKTMWDAVSLRGLFLDDATLDCNGRVARGVPYIHITYVLY